MVQKIAAPLGKLSPRAGLGASVSLSLVSGGHTGRTGALGRRGPFVPPLLPAPGCSGPGHTVVRSHLSEVPPCPGDRAPAGTDPQERDNEDREPPSGRAQRVGPSKSTLCPAGQLEVVEKIL